MVAEMRVSQTTDDKPAIIETLRALYLAFYDLPCKTGRQFNAMDAASAVIMRYPKPKTDGKKET